MELNLESAFLGLTLVTVLFLIYIGFNAIKLSSESPKKDTFILVFCLVGWQWFIYGLSSTGLLVSYDFPPLFALAFIVPSFLFTGVFLFRSRNKQWPKFIPEQWVIYFQSFRILVELLFVFALVEGVFNAEVTIEGYNYDLVFAASAPIVGILVYALKVLPRRILVYWNYLGLGVLASVIVLFLCSIYQPELFGSPEPLLPLISMTYPYVLIAGFLMPVAVFLHILSLVQLNRKL
ncbi:MAG: hypothetical protein ACI9YL_001280 [Luteibaculaceae bacterium]|jgi:hypothetical protein